MPKIKGWTRTKKGSWGTQWKNDETGEVIEVARREPSNGANWGIHIGKWAEGYDTDTTRERAEKKAVKIMKEYPNGLPRSAKGRVARMAR